MKKILVLFLAAFFAVGTIIGLSIAVPTAAPEGRITCTITFGWP